MLTGDLLATLPLGAGAGEVLMEGTKESVRRDLGQIFQIDGDDQKYLRVKNEMLSNIDWTVLYQEYLRFKEDTREFSNLGSSIASAVNTLNNSNRQKRQVTSSQNQPDLENLFEFIQSEEFLNMSSKYGEMLVSVGEEMSKIMDELEILTSQIQYLDAESLLTLAVTSPRVSVIISSLVNIMDQMEPVFLDTPYMTAFQAMKEGFVILDDFVKSTSKNIEISSLLLNWDQIKTLMTEIEAFTPSEIDDIGGTVLSTQGMFLAMSRLSEFQCNSTVLERYIEFYPASAPLNSTSDTLASSVCGFMMSENWLSLLSVVDIPSAFDFLSSIFLLSPQSLALAANITEEELYDAMENLEAASDLLPTVEESLENLLDNLNLTEFSSATISRLLCGTNFTELEFNYKVESFTD